MNYFRKIIYRYKKDGFVKGTKHFFSIIANFLRRNVLALNKLIAVFITNIEKHLPIRNNMVFECESDFADNPRAFYEFIRKETNFLHKHKAVWLVNKARYCNEHFSCKNVLFINRNDRSMLNTIKLNYYLCTSKWFIFSHPWWFKNWRKDQIVINTRHSVFQIKAGGKKNKEKTFDYVLATSEYTRELLYPATLQIEEKQVLLLGVPRIDLLYYPPKDIGELLSNYNGQKIILSMETFKQSKWWIDSDAKDSFSINVINNIQQLMNLDAFLMRHNCVLIVKIHHLQNTAFLTVTDLQRIYYITDDDLFNADIQVNDLLKVSDMLLTDYSSVCYDYLLCDKPIGYMVSDKDEYARGFLIDDVFSIMPGKKIYNYTQLCDFIESYFVAGKDEYLPDRRRLKEKIFKYNDSDNCKRLYEWLLKTGKDRYL